MYPFFVIIERQTFFIVLFPLMLSSIGFVNSRSAVTRVSNFCGVEKNRFALFFEKHIKLIVIVVLIISSLTYLKYSSFDKVPEPIEQIKAGHFINNTYTMEYEKLNVMSRKPVVSFYSDARFTMIPYANSKEVIDFAKLYDVDFIVVDERFLSQWDFYDELLNLDEFSDDVELIYEDTTGKAIKMFRVRK